MIVVCKVKECPYYFCGCCTDLQVRINENGQCEHIFKNGQVRPTAFEYVNNDCKRDIKTIEGEFREDGTNETRIDGGNILLEQEDSETRDGDGENDNGSGQS